MRTLSQIHVSGVISGIRPVHVLSQWLQLSPSTLPALVNRASMQDLVMVATLSIWIVRLRHAFHAMRNGTNSALFNPAWLSGVLTVAATPNFCPSNAGHATKNRQRKLKWDAIIAGRRIQINCSQLHFQWLNVVWISFCALHAYNFEKVPLQCIAKRVGMQMVAFVSFAGTRKLDCSWNFIALVELVGVRYLPGLQSTSEQDSSCADLWKLWPEEGAMV